MGFRKYQNIISLPLYQKMTDQYVEDFIEAVTDMIQPFRYFW